MARKDVEQAVYSLLRELNRNEACEVTPDADMRADLMLTSIDAVDLLMELEGGFGVQLPIVDPRCYGTGACLCAQLEQLLAE